MLNEEESATAKSDITCSIRFICLMSKHSTHESQREQYKFDDAQNVQELIYKHLQGYMYCFRF